MKNWYDIFEGAQIVEMNDSYVIVNKNGRDYQLDIETFNGECCGYAEVETKLFYEKDSNRNPIITNVQIEEENNYCEEVATITFFGESKPLAAISCECGSGSGWQYGACVSVVCKPLDIDEVVCSW